MMDLFAQADALKDDDSPLDELMAFENDMNSSPYGEEGEEAKHERSQITIDSNLLDDSQWEELEKSQQYLDEVGLKLTPDKMLSPSVQVDNFV